ncbi:uncharacterized protein Z519_10206 [Cladophialophora bantiana CBS 173.52]|uniref:Uncharacterized protein n=1 Tax=Cladophialophora bantiana (strain ATCC 10958 / CBS 173.52 / CDC B-1940 / NIH 8579) TaxID=1442370 RepID=A0A0D2FS00_CLAB1|nr:uncharacterized protein Z519_10206 [Cladophialophora bantiana CBS 173.52]KIW89352.1 hypothetical protein Z519_10206 [Cladophialophora bantiana CBS 173.52]
MNITAGRRVLWQTQRLFVPLRAVSTLSNNPHIYVFKDPKNPSSHILSLLPTDPPTPSLAIGTASQLPPTPRSFAENPKFLPILHSVISENASSDPEVQSQAAVMISSSGSSFFQTVRRQQTGSSGASDQGGHGSAGRGGWVHVSDQRHIPDFGRIAEPEDIFGSVEVDGRGKFVDGHGGYQPSGTYRVCTNDGILGLTDFMRRKLVERLKVQEAAERNKQS